MLSAFIVDFQRTPFGKLGGLLSQIRPDDLASYTISALRARNPWLQEQLPDEVIFGCANQSGEDNRNIARFASLISGLPTSIPAYTVNRLCASGMQAAMNAAMQITTGVGVTIIAGGVESMSRAPYVLLKSTKAFDRNQAMADTTLGSRFVNPRMNELFYDYSMGETGEIIAKRWNISREQQDEFAFLSHMKYIDALYDGHFSDELIKLEEIKGVLEFPLKDEGARSDTTLDKLSRLRTVFREKGSLTAGNSAGLNDGASALLITSEATVNKYTLSPLARIVSIASAGVHPDIMGTGPIPATKKVLQQAGLEIDDIDLFEINEAFAVQVLCCIDELKIDPSKVNIDGGSIAIGHPLGASGNRILGHLALSLRKKKLKYGVATMCVGVGQGTAVLIENLDMHSY